MKHATEVFGDASDVCFASTIINAYLHSNMLEKGLEVAEALIKKATQLKVESMTGKKLLLLSETSKEFLNYSDSKQNYYWRKHLKSLQPEA